MNQDKQAKKRLQNRKRWQDLELICRKTKTVLTPSNKDATLVVEIRRHVELKTGRLGSTLKVRAGRIDSYSKDGISWSWWFEDVKQLLELIAEAYAEAMPFYTEISFERIRENIEAEKERLQAIKDDSSDNWKKQLLSIREAMTEAGSE